MSPSDESDVLVYSRDRSWYQSRPSSDYAPRMHREARNDPGMAACEPFTIMLNEETKKWASEVSASLLCRRCFRPTSPEVTHE